MKNEEKDLRHPYVEHEKLNEDTDRVKELLAEEFSGYTLPALRLLLRRTIEALAKQEELQRSDLDAEYLEMSSIEKLPDDELSYIG